MPSHSHQYERFRYEFNARFDRPSGNSRYYPCNLETDQDPGRFSETYFTTSVGGGCSHNNMPPYLTANCWKRTG